MKKEIFILFFIVVTIIPFFQTVSLNPSENQISIKSNNINLSSKLITKIESHTKNLQYNEIGLNETTKNSVFNFLMHSQQDGSFPIPSMDYAYFLGMSLFYLNNLQNIDYSDISQVIIRFIEDSRNDDGGYGNWNGSRSSMESTFQALQLYKYLDNYSNITVNEFNKTISFVQKLKTNLKGYYPLENWDVPDMSSTFRALWIKSEVNKTYPQISLLNDTDIELYILNNYVLPFFISSGSGYSEVLDGQAEVLSSLYSLNSFSLLNIEDPNGENIAKFVLALTSSNGGVAGREGSSTTTGFTANALEIYFLLSNYSSFDLSSVLSQSFIDFSLNYLKANKKVGSGFTSSDRDSTPELISTFFVLKTYSLLKERSLLPVNIDLSGLFEYITTESDPNFGFGDYPGDIPQLTHTVNALLTGKILNNLSWINPLLFRFINNSYDESKGAYAFRPFSTGFIKYTYYGLRAIRTTNLSINTQPQLKQFILNSQNENGGFGQDPLAKLSYLTHTFWAINSLYILNELSNSNLKYNVLNFLGSLKNQDGSYSNFPGINGSLASTYRAVKVYRLLNKSITISNNTVLSFLSPSGGFYASQTQKTPTMESTYYGIYLSLLNNIEINKSQIKDFVFSLFNQDGGFGLRPGFTSRVTSTYYAVNILYLLENYGNKFSLQSEDPIDFFSPIITPSFIPSIDTNKTFFGTYKTSALVSDAESEIMSTWSEVIWTSTENNEIISSTFQGKVSNEDLELYSYILGPFKEDGILFFRLLAEDVHSNIASTKWFSILTLGIENVSITESTNYLALFLEVITPLILSFVLIESFVSKNRTKKKIDNEVKSMISKDTEEQKDVNINIIYLMIIISVISIISRILLSETLIVLNQSLFLFRFIFGILIILIAKYVFGLKMLGLFGPTILVIAMMSVGPVWGLAIFLNIFIVNYVIRILISPLNFAVGFRIGLMMVFTISFIGLLEQLGEIFLIPVLSGSILVPIIITPWFTDRFVTEIEQNNQYSAFLRLFTTLFVSIVAYIIMNSTELVSFVVFNPETWVVIVFVILYFGRTQQYTLLDKKRFKRIFNNESNPLTILVRNRDYIAKYNQSILFPFINKFNMKEQFEKWQVPSAELLAVIEHENQISDTIDRLLKSQNLSKGFVIKPSQSFGGKGIIIVSEISSEGHFIINGEKYNQNALEHEIKKINRGEYLTSQTSTDKDIVLIEEKIVCDPSLAEISIGLPDIRIIIFKGIPVMAMTRLPTVESGGKANLKQGAIGSAIQIDTGIIFRSEWKGFEVKIHPDTNKTISGYKFSNWKQILATACLAQKSTGLGYVGVDIVIDDTNRVLVLEVNKRPGLEIQNINAQSLIDRFKFLENNNIDGHSLSPLKSAQLGMDYSIKEWRGEIN